MGALRPLIEKLHNERTLAHGEFVRMLAERNPEDSEYMRSLAQKTTIDSYGRDIYLRGLIEFTNYCRDDCLYSVIRNS